MMAEIQTRESVDVDDIAAYDAAVSRGQHHLSLGEYQAAIAAFTAAIRISPAQRLAYTYRASAYEVMGDPERCQADLSAARRFMR